MTALLSFTKQVSLADSLSKCDVIPYLIIDQMISKLHDMFLEL